MNDYSSGILSNRPLVIVVSAIIIIVYLLLKWKRTGKYVEESNKIYSEHYRKMFEYSDRVRTDQRWPGFLAMIQERHQLVDTGEPIDDETYKIHHRFIWDANGTQQEPNEAQPGTTGITAYLKRKAKPRYLRVTMNMNGEITEDKVSGMSWYDMFEKSV